MATILHNQDPQKILPWLTPELQAEIAEFALEEDTENIALPLSEKCGFIVRGEEGIVLVRSPNLHENPLNAFRPSPSLWAQHRANIIAVWHSHTAAEEPPLSLEDIAHAISLNVPYLCFHVDGIWDYFDPAVPNPFPLEEREGKDDPTQLDYYRGWRWQWGRMDCSHLIYYYYLGVYGIRLRLPPPDRSARSMFAKNWNRFRESLDENGFRELDIDEDLQLGDIVVLCHKHENPHHGAIVVGVDEFDIPTLLHIESDETLSRLAQYSIDLQQVTDSIWRHPQLELLEPPTESAGLISNSMAT